MCVCVCLCMLVKGTLCTLGYLILMFLGFFWNVLYCDGL